MADLLIRNIRPADSTGSAPAVDVSCRAGRIAAIGPNLDVADTTTVVEGGGAILLPSFTDAHAHLDSTRLGLPFRPHTAEPGLAGLIANDRDNWRHAGASVAERATHTLGVTIASGTTRVRSHAQVDPDTGLERLEGVLSARSAHADRASVQVVAFPQAGILQQPGTASLLAEALRAGADLIGGLDPAGFDRDPVGHLDVVFGLAERHHVGVDIHLHDSGELGAFEIELICDRTRSLGMEGNVTISHCFGLSTVDAARTEKLVELLAMSDVAVATVAPATRPPLPLESLGAAGVRLGLGQDGIRDFWSPYGNGDMLDRTWQLAYRNGFRHDHLVEACVDVATVGGAAVMGMGDVGLAVGDVADLVVVHGDNVTAAVMDRSPRPLVIRGGVVIARDGVLV